MTAGDCRRLSFSYRNQELARMALTVTPDVVPDVVAYQQEFIIGETIVHPAFGVGRIDWIGTETIAGQQVGLIHIALPDKRLCVKVPVGKAQSLGLRHLMSRAEMAAAYDVVSQRPRTMHGARTRRAADCMAKVNSGQPQAIAEVVRDLRRPGPHGSYTEREVFDCAVDRLAGELAALEGLDRTTARLRLLEACTSREHGDRVEARLPGQPDRSELITLTG
jgi:CarD family transcriptional regulator